MRTFDCFLFAGIGAEWDVLRWRVEELAGVVDEVVIVIGDRTFQGQPRPPLRAERIPSSASRLNFYQAALPAQAAHPMDREIAQRNAIIDALRALDAEPDDLILVSDVDEIPGAAAVEQLKALRGPSLVWQRLYHGWLNMRCTTEPFWPGTHAAPFRWFGAGNTPHNLRLNRNLPAVDAGGWHFSFLGGVDGYREKLAAWSHHEWNKPPYNTPENIAAALRDGRDWDIDRRLEYEFVPVDESYPRWVYEHQGAPSVAQHIHPLPVQEAR